MKRIPLLLAVLHLASGLPVSAQEAATPAAPAESVLAAVTAADDARVAAMTSPERAKLESLFSAELRYAHSNGKVDTKASFIDALATGKMTYAAWKYEERNFTFPALGIALMTGRAAIHFGTPESIETVLAFLAVWRLEDGHWRFLAWQSCKPPVKDRP